MEPRQPHLQGHVIVRAPAVFPVHHCSLYNVHPLMDLVCLL